MSIECNETLNVMKCIAILVTIAILATISHYFSSSLLHVAVFYKVFLKINMKISLY